MRFFCVIMYSIKDGNDYMKKVTILLSKYCDPFSKLIALSSGEYTHISISLDPEEKVFYSFNLKGFIEENWENKKSKYLLPERLKFYIYTDDETFVKLEKEINRFKERRNEIKYSVFGTILCFTRIPHNFKKEYFCSRFVAEVLTKSGAVKLKKKSSQYLPMHIIKELRPHLLKKKKQRA